MPDTPLNTALAAIDCEADVPLRVALAAIDWDADVPLNVALAAIDCDAEVPLSVAEAATERVAESVSTSDAPAEEATEAARPAEVAAEAADPALEVEWSLTTNHAPLYCCSKSTESSWAISDVLSVPSVIVIALAEESVLITSS